MEKEILLVASKLKEYIKSKGLHTAGDAIDGLNAAVYELVDKAIARTKANGRSTVRPTDF